MIDGVDGMRCVLCGIILDRVDRVWCDLCGIILDGVEVCGVSCMAYSGQGVV